VEGGKETKGKEAIEEKTLTQRWGMSYSDDGEGEAK
jgi:hypothetical protein